MRSTLAVLFVITSMAILVGAQSPLGRKEVNIRGWKVPRVDHLPKTKEILSESNHDTISEIVFSLKGSEPSTLIRENLYCEFTNLSAFAFKGKTFAVGGDCVIFSNHVSNTRQYRITRSE